MFYMETKTNFIRKKIENKNIIPFNCKKTLIVTPDWESVVGDHINSDMQ